MANWLKAREANQFKINIPRYKVVNYYAEFELVVECSQYIKWKTYRRYSEFKTLFDELIKIDNKFKVNFPPKKSFNSMSSNLLNNRRISLETYLNDIIRLCSNFLPRQLFYFLEMNEYEIHGITTTMAKKYFDYGSILLKSTNFFEITVLSINAINQRMCSQMPTNIYNIPVEDFGIVLEIINALKKVLVIPNSIALSSSDNGYGTSSIKMSALTFDISIFASVTDLQINSVEITNLRGLYKMNTTIERLRVHHCLKSIDDLLFAEFPHPESSIENLQRFDGPLRCTIDVNLSNNSITCIDRSIVTLRQVQLLNLSNNQISDILYMQSLTFLTELNLSHNNLDMCQTESLSNKLGSIKKLYLNGNKLSSLNIVDRMFSLEYLDVSDNQLSGSVALLPLCRLECLESLFINDNPICSNPDFVVMVFDLFLDRFHNVQVNGYNYEDIPLNIRIDINEYRESIKSSILSGNSTMSLSFDGSSDLHNKSTKANTLSSIDVSIDEYESSDLSVNTILSIPDVFNIFIYWFFVAYGMFVNPRELLWVTEIYSPNRNIRPRQVLLATCGTYIPNILHCSLIKGFDFATKKHIITIQPTDFFVLSQDYQRTIIASDKSFLRVDVASKNRHIYLCNGGSVLDAFICRLYHIEEGMPCYGDSRIVCLNDEDRMEMMRRFIDLWRLDMVITLKRNCPNVEIHADADSEILFISRAMLEMKNGFQILLTVVVTREIMYLVDERIYDWPDFNKHPNLSDQSPGTNCSPYNGLCGQFPFLRTNAYFLCETDVCVEISTTIDQGDIIDNLCPIFRYPVKITFNSAHGTLKDPLTLLFTNEQKIRHLYQIVHQQYENTSPVTIISPCDITLTVQEPYISEMPSHLRYLNVSYSEIRLCLSLSCLKLSKLARSSPDEVQQLYQTMFPDCSEDTIFAFVWSKFIYLNFDDSRTQGRESPGLVCLSSNGINVLYEVEEDCNTDEECYSDPEDDHPNTNNRMTILKTMSFSVSNLFRTCVGLNYQWVTLSFRTSNQQSESERLILVVRNKGLCKHIITWIETMINDRYKSSDQDMSNEVGTPVTVEYDHQAGDIKELLYQIQRMCLCGSIDLVHYCSLEDVRFATSMNCKTKNSVSNNVFSNAAVLTTENIAIVQHNISEYPMRTYAPGTIRGSPNHLQFQVLTVVSLIDCLQLQLPGHDRSVLIIVIKSKDKNKRHNTTLTLHLSISCQKEQKRLIDKIRQQRSKYLNTDSPIPVNVC